MSHISYWMDIVHAKPDQCHIRRQQLPDIDTIRFVKNTTDFYEHIFYLGTVEQIRRLLESSAERSGTVFAAGTMCITLFSSGYSPDLLSLASACGVNLVCSEEDLFTLHDLLDEQMQRYRAWCFKSQSSMLREPGKPGNAPDWYRKEFQVLLKEIVEGRLTDKQEIDTRFSRIGCGPGIFCSFILVDFEKKDRLQTDESRILAELDELFPDTSRTVYDGCIVLLLARPNREFQPRPVFDTAAFTRILERWQAHASISNATSRRVLLRTQYMLTKQVLALAPRLFPEGRERIYYFEDFAEYLMIELAVSSFQSHFGHDDIVPLIHPDAIRLIEYDRDHHGDLMKFVYHYCLCNCNIVQTARNAYMHRNTAASRLARVHELITADLADGEVQQRMIFSYKVYHYYQRCSGMNLEERMERL